MSNSKKFVLFGTLFALLILPGCSLFSSQSPDDSVGPPLPVTGQVEKAVSQLPWLITACVIGLGISAALLLLKLPLIAGALSAACATTLAVAIAVSQWYWLIAYVVGAVFLAGMGYLIWLVYKHRKALFEAVGSIEKIKRFLPDKTTTLLFGGNEGDEDHGEIGLIQSKSTEGIVKAMRAKLAEK